MYSWLQEAIAEKAEVVTASRRLARELRAAYDGQQIASGHKAWLTPAIRTWHDWLGRQAASVENPTSIPNRLDAFSSAWLLERCLRRQLADGLPGVGGIANRIAAAVLYDRGKHFITQRAHLDACARGHAVAERRTGDPGPE